MAQDIMKKLTTLFVLAASLCTLSGCVVAPATTTTSVTETRNGTTTTTVTTTVAPPALPVYEQPVAPGPGYIWTPGYWAWSDAAYYWAPGVWVLPPRAGLLWTPGWWGWSGGVYRWHLGYWGPTIGFYGGINYGFGYFGTGYVGGYWHEGQFYYNRTVNNIQNTHITNVYVQNVTHNTTINRVSYNGGSGGLAAQPTAAEKAALQQPHMAATPEQMRQHAMAVHERGQRYNPSGAGPAVYGSSRVSEHFNDPAAVRTPMAVHPQASPAPAPSHEMATPQGMRERADAHERGAAETEPQRLEPQHSEPQRAQREQQMAHEKPQPRQAVRAQRPRPARRAPPRPQRREHEKR